MAVVRQGGKHQFQNLARMCCWDRDSSQTKLIFSEFVCLRNDIFMSECSEDTCHVKNGSSMYLGDDGAKESVVICDYVYFSLKNVWTQDGF